MQARASRIVEPIVWWYSYAIVAAHLAAWIYFATTGALYALGSQVEPLCWPYFEDCWKIRFSSPDTIRTILAAYLAMIITAGLLLAAGKWKAAWIVMLVTSLFLAAVVSLDYRLRANQFYMLLWLCFVFLFWPRRVWAVPLLIVLFYFWAGVLKLNWEWLSGSVLYHDLWLIPHHLNWLACTYVVVLEILLIWGLLARRLSTVVAVLLQLVVFHIQSLSQIHWFYPLLMGIILSWFVLSRVHGAATEQASVTAFFSGRAPRSAYALVVIFSSFQLAPLAYPGDADLTGQGRVFALHMFEARQVCEVKASLGYENGAMHSVDIKYNKFPPRMICDPIVYFNRIQNLCRRPPRGIVRVGFHMRSKKTTDETFTTIVDTQDFCSTKNEYRVFAANSWMFSH